MRASVYALAVRACRRHLILLALNAAGGNRTVAARALGLQRSYLQLLMRQLGLGR